MYYYKLVDNEGKVYGVESCGSPHSTLPSNCLQIEYEEYLDICENLGFEP